MCDQRHLLAEAKEFSSRKNSSAPCLSAGSNIGFFASLTGEAADEGSWVRVCVCLGN